VTDAVASRTWSNRKRKTLADHPDAAVTGLADLAGPEAGISGHGQGSVTADGAGDGEPSAHVAGEYDPITRPQARRNAANCRVQ
jgi:hypothetical protein